MPRARRKPHSPATQTTDTGPDTPAQRAGAVYYRPDGGRDGEVHKKRATPLDELLRRGRIDQAQHNAANIALKLYEETQRSPVLLREAVDGTPDPGLAIVASTEAQFAYARAVQDIPARSLYVYRWVVEAGRALHTMRWCRDQQSAEYRHKVKLLRLALDSLRV